MQRMARTNYATASSCNSEALRENKINAVMVDELTTNFSPPPQTPTPPHLLDRSCVSFDKGGMIDKVSVFGGIVVGFRN